MASQTKIYEGIPVGAVFEASQKSLRTLKATLKKVDPTALCITAKSAFSMKSFGQEVELSMVEVGPVTELKIRTTSGQSLDWGAGKVLINDIISNIDTEIEKIKSEGRIPGALPPVYKMGQVTQQKYFDIKNAVPKKSSFWSQEIGFGNAFIITLTVGFLFMFVGFLILNRAAVDFTRYDCGMVSSEVAEMSLTNGYGGRSDIISISDLRLISKTKSKITCTGQVETSANVTKFMYMIMEKREGSAKILTRVFEP